MFPFKLLELEVYYIKNKKSGKRSENIMVKKCELPHAGLDPGPPTRESDCQTTTPARLYRSGLRNPLKHGSAAPRKRLRMAEKVRRILSKTVKKKIGIKKKRNCWFCFLIWLKPRSFQEHCPWTPPRAWPLDQGFTTSRLRMVCHPPNFVAFCEIWFCHIEN